MLGKSKIRTTNRWWPAPNIHMHIHVIFRTKYTIEQIIPTLIHNHQQTNNWNELKLTQERRNWKIAWGTIRTKIKLCYWFEVCNKSKQPNLLISLEVKTCQYAKVWIVIRCYLFSQSVLRQTDRGRPPQEPKHEQQLRT